jgi:sporulation protein YlmC with PRC-barrel domain
VIRLSRLVGQDAIALRTAAKTGTVKGIGLDGNRNVSVALSDATIPAAAVRSFEGDVLTYDDDHLADVSPVRTDDPRGAHVLDMHGDGLGAIEDLIISADGVIETIVLTDTQTIEGARLRAIGSYAIVTVEPPPPINSTRAEHDAAPVQDPNTPI